MKTSTQKNDRSADEKNDRSADKKEKAMDSPTAEEIHEDLKAQGVFDLPYLEMMAKVTLRTMPEPGYVNPSMHLVMKRGFTTKEKWTSLYWLTLRANDGEYWGSERDPKLQKICQDNNTLKVRGTDRARSYTRKMNYKRVFIREKIIRHLVANGCRIYEKAGPRYIVGNDNDSFAVQEILVACKNLKAVEDRIMRDMQKIGQGDTGKGMADQEYCDPLLDIQFARNLSQVIKSETCGQEQEHKEEELLTGIELVEEALPALLTSQNGKVSEEEASVGSWNLLQEEDIEDSPHGVDGLVLSQAGVEDIPLSSEEIAKETVGVDDLTPESVFFENEEHEGTTAKRVKLAKGIVRKKSRKAKNGIPTIMPETPRRRTMSRRVTPPKKSFPFLPDMEYDEDDADENFPMKNSLAAIPLPNFKMNVFDLIRRSTRNTSSLLDDDIEGFQESDHSVLVRPKRQLFDTTVDKNYSSEENEENIFNGAGASMSMPQRKKMMSTIMARLAAMENRMGLIESTNRRLRRRINMVENMKECNQRLLFDDQELNPFGDTSTQLPLSCHSTNISKKRKRTTSPTQSVATKLN